MGPRSSEPLTCHDTHLDTSSVSGRARGVASLLAIEMMSRRCLALPLLLLATAAAGAEEGAAAGAEAATSYPGETKKYDAGKTDEEMTPEEREARREKAGNSVYCEYDDCYELLGVNPDSGPIPIKRAYRRLAAEWHPDKCPGGDLAECKAVFPKYANAYEILSNTEMRRNYDYLRNHPYEFPGFYLRYSRPKYAPKSDLRFVLALTVLVASAFQYLFRKSLHEQAVSALKKDPKTRYQERLKALVAAMPAKPSATNGSGEAKGGGDSKPASESDKGGKSGPATPKKPSKDELKEARRKEAEAQLDAEIADELAEFAPKLADTLVVSAFKLPVSTLAAVKWFLAGGHKEPAYRTRKALGLSAAEYGYYSEAEQAELEGLELWISDNLAAYEEKHGAGGKPKEKSAKEKRAQRFKKNNPSSNAGLEG